MQNKFKFLILCGIFSPLIAYSSIALAILNMPHFSWIRNALSDLGVWRDSANIFNYGLMISAIIQLLFIFGLGIVYRRILIRIGLIFYAIATMFLFLIGFYPESVGRIHFYVSFLFFILTPLSLIVTSTFLIKEYREIKFGIITLLLAFSSYIPWLFPWKAMNISGIAIPELLSTIPISIWNIYNSILIIKSWNSIVRFKF